MKSKELFYHNPEEAISLERKDIPVVNSFISTLRNKEAGLTKETFDFLIKGSQKEHFSYLMSLASRQAGDRTGLLGYLVGVPNNAQHTEKIITRVGQHMLDVIKHSPNKQTVINLLNGEEVSSLNIRAFNLLDNLAYKTVLEIKNAAYNCYQTSAPGEQTPQAKAFKEANYEKLQELLTLYDDNFQKLLNYEYETDFNGYVTKISQAPIIPKLNIEPLLEILPPSLTYPNSQSLSADTPLGFVSKINMAGSPITRSLAKYTDYLFKTRELVNYY